MLDKKKVNQIKKHNENLLKRMRDGESLNLYDAADSWFPPRPKIKKDKKAIAILYKS